MVIAPEIPVCNKCGKKLDLWDAQEKFSISRKLGYGTKYDGATLILNLCCECMDKLIDECKGSPISVKPIYEFTNNT